MTLEAEGASQVAHSEIILFPRIHVVTRPATDLPVEEDDGRVEHRRMDVVTATIRLHVVDPDGVGAAAMVIDPRPNPEGGGVGGGVVMAHETLMGGPVDGALEEVRLESHGPAPAPGVRGQIRFPVGAGKRLVAQETEPSPLFFRSHEVFPVPVDIVAGGARHLPVPVQGETRGNGHGRPHPRRVGEAQRSMASIAQAVDLADEDLLRAGEGKMAFVAFPLEVMARVPRKIRRGEERAKDACEDQPAPGVAQYRKPPSDPGRSGRRPAFFQRVNLRRAFSRRSISAFPLPPSPGDSPCLAPAAWISRTASSRERKRS